MKSSLTGTTTVITFAEATSSTVLLVDLALDCPACGQHRVRFAGHHLRAIHRLLTEWIQQYPELTGAESGIEEVGRMRWSGQAGQKPEDN